MCPPTRHELSLADLAPRRAELDVPHSGRSEASRRGSGGAEVRSYAGDGRDWWIYPPTRRELSLADLASSPRWCGSLRRRWRDNYGEGMGPLDPWLSLMFPVAVSLEATYPTASSVQIGLHPHRRYFF